MDVHTGETNMSRDAARTFIGLMRMFFDTQNDDDPRKETRLGRDTKPDLIYHSRDLLVWLQSLLRIAEPQRARSSLVRRMNQARGM